MSTVAHRIVSFAANQLPEPERSRRLEEWGADLDGATEQGLSRTGIALGALALALRSPLPSPVAAGWWAQWALAISALGPVVWLSLWTSGLFLSDPVIRDIIEPIITASTIASLLLVLIVGIRGRGFPWVASGAVILVCLTGALWVVGVSWEVVLTPMLALAIVGLGLVGWRLNRTATTAPSHRVAVVAFISVPLLAVAIDAAGPMNNWVPIAAVFIAVVVALVVAVRSPRADAAGWRGGMILLATVSAGIIVIAALVADSITTAASSTAGSTKLWARIAPSLMLQTGATVVAVATLLALCAVLAAIARRRRTGFSVNGVVLLATAASASVGARLPYLGSWHGITADPMVNVIGLVGCVAAAVGVVLLVAPRRVRQERLAEVRVD